MVILAIAKLKDTERAKGLSSIQRAPCIDFLLFQVSSSFSP